VTVTGSQSKSKQTTTGPFKATFNKKNRNAPEWDDGSNQRGGPRKNGQGKKTHQKNRMRKKNKQKKRGKKKNHTATVLEEYSGRRPGRKNVPKK